MGRDRLGLTEEPVFCHCVQSVISLMKWSITRVKPLGTAVSGSIGTDAVASGSSG